MLRRKADMLNKIYDFIQSEKLIDPGDTVICGLSGGADSVCLLMSLNMLSSKLGITVEALHVNHCLRGSESDRDEQFCRELCSRLGIEFTAVSCNVKKFAEENSLSTEEGARKLRYSIFHEHSAGKKLATAHNADDNLETVILNLTRGSALKGIAGIPPIRGNIIRPLLSVQRSEIEAFLSENSQNYVTDSTNLSNDYTRNKIRHNIVPLLRELNPSVTATSIKSISALREENSLIEKETQLAENKCRCNNTLCGLAEYHAVIRKRCAARLLTDNSLPYTAERLDSIDSIIVNGGKLNISGDIFMISDGNKLELVTISNDHMPLLCAELRIGDNSIFPERLMICELITCDNLKKIEAVNNLLTSYVLDYDKIIGRAFVRNRRYGDKIRLSGRNFTSSVKKIINEKITSAERPYLHFIQDEQGTIFAEKIGIADRVTPDENTQNLLRITILNNIDRS